MDEKQRQEVANFRYGLIAPLVTRTLNPGEQAAKLREVACHTYDIPHSDTQKISLRTLERYLKAYREGGWEALLPSVRADKLQCKQIAPDVLEKAIALKQEQPTRSVRQIMAILDIGAVCGTRPAQRKYTLTAASQPRYDTEGLGERTEKHFPPL